MLRRLASVTLAVSVLVGLAACASAPAPAPVESAPVFASDAEAFAAAEATYRAYVDALNQVDLADPATFEAVYDLTTGNTLAEARRALTTMHADDWTVSGTSLAIAIVPTTYRDNSVSLDACLDVSRVQLQDARGAPMVGADRPDIQEMRITVTFTESVPTKGTVSSATGRSDGTECR